jgi:hypothetical protein
MSDQRPLDLVSDPEDLNADAFEHLAANMTGWRPPDPGPTTWLVEAVSRPVGALIDALQVRADELYLALGELDGITRIQATPATGLTTWTFTAATTIQAGTQLELASSDGTVIALAVDETFSADGAGTETTIAVSATEDFYAAGYDGLTGTVRLIEPNRYVTAVALEGPLQGGSDLEDVADFRQRIISLRALFTARPVKAPEFVALALSNPLVARATAIDLLHPDTDEDDRRATTALFVHGPDGEPMLLSQREKLEAWLRDLVEAGYDVFVRDPDFTELDVAISGVTAPGAVLADVRSAAEATVRAYLNPGTWGSTDEPLGETVWRNQPVVGRLNLAAAVKATPDLDRVTNVQLALAGGTLGTADITMTGYAPLPNVIDVDVTGIVAP